MPALQNAKETADRRRVARPSQRGIRAAMTNAHRQECLCYSFGARHSRSTRSQFQPQTNNAGLRVLAVLARARVFLEFRVSAAVGAIRKEKEKK